MADEQKKPLKAADGAGTPAHKTAAEGGADALPVKPEPAAAKPPGPAVAGAAAPQPAVPVKPAVVPAKPVAKPSVKPDPWSSPLLDELQKRFPGAISEAVIFRNLPSVNVAKAQLLAVSKFLRSAEGGAYNLLTDETAVDYPKREKRFDIIYLLYSFAANTRLRLRVQVGEGENVPSVTGIWPTANWLEREIFDMFGVTFDGHPNLKRLLMPDGWTGHPLRKDYDILKQDQEWVKANLGIDSAQ